MGYGIIGHYGLPGSGKSRDMVEHDIIEAALEGKRVYTNLPLLLDAVYAYYPKIKQTNIVIKTGDELCQMLVDRSHRGDDGAGELENSAIVFDEIQRFFPSGYQKRTELETTRREAMISFLAWSRHDHCEFIWATQHYASVDFELRRKTHMYVQHEDLFHLGFSARWVARNQLPDQTTGDPRSGAGKERTFGPDPIIFRCYKSAEKGNHKRGGRLTGQIPLKIKIILALTIIVISLTIYLFYKRGNPLKITPISAKISQPKAIEKDSTKNKRQDRDECVDLSGYICFFGRCTGYRSGVPQCTYPDTATSGPRLLERVPSRVPDGRVPALPISSDL